VPTLDRVSKAVAAISILLIVVLQIALNPDQTWVLRALATLALLMGWLSGRLKGQSSHTFWLLVAPLAPAALLGLARREGPVVELVWMAGMTGALLRTMSWSTWELPPGWRPLASGSALAISLVWPVMIAREAGFSIAGLSDIGAIVTAAQLSAPQVIGWTLHVALTQLLGLLWLDWLCGWMIRQPDRVPPVAHGLWVGATLATFVAIYQGSVDLTFLNTPAWVVLRRATGTLLDANAYGMCAALAGPMAFLALRPGRLRHAPLLATAILVLNLIGMWMSGSRTALLCSMVGMTSVALASWSASGAFVRRALPTVAAITAVVIVTVVYTGTAVGPLQRLLETPAGASSPVLELWNRGGYGVAALQMLRDYPFTGVGLGAFHVLAPDYYQGLYGPIPFDNAQNWWRHQAAEFGILGGTAVLALSGVIGWRVLFGRSRPEQRFASRAVRGLLAGLGVCSLLGGPTQSPFVLLWFMLLVAWMTVLVQRADVPWLREHEMNATRLLGAFAVAYALLHIPLGYAGPLSVEARAARAHRAFVSGTYPLEDAPTGGSFRWTSRPEAHFSWPVEGRWLVLRAWVQHPDIEQNPVDVRIDTACGPLLVEQLSSRDPATVDVEIPAGVDFVQATVSVSRTWRVSDYGGVDTRRLGAAVQADFPAEGDLPEGVRNSARDGNVRQIRLPACPR